MAVQIVLVGCGIQARKHVHCYGKLRNKFGLSIRAVIDPNPQNRHLCLQAVEKAGFSLDSIVACDSLEHCSTDVFCQRTITDVAAPNKLHFTLSAQAEARGADFLVVEKPLAHSLDEAARFLTLRSQVFVLENYLFSSVTRGIADYIRCRELVPLFLKSEFSKDRRLDSMNGRGAHSGYTPHVFAIEMPHQVAIANSILGTPGVVCDAWHHDMIFPDGRLCNHGEGAITMMHGGIPSYNFSCLQGFRHMPMNYRNVRIFCSGGYKILGFYSTSIEQDSSLIVYRNNRIENRYVYHDDSLTFALESAIRCRIDGAPPINNAKYGIDIMAILEAGRKAAKKSV